MKILSASQLHEADKATIDAESITSTDLMERAATCCFNWIEGHFGKAATYLVVCGVGNNGGDGLVIARLLIAMGKNVAVFAVGDKDKTSADFNTNLHKLPAEAVTFITDSEQIKGNYDIVIDALFGTGLNKEVKGLAADVIDEINKLQAIKISIDVPSGLYADDNTGNYGAKVKADYTLTFEMPKLAFFFAENAPYVGEFQILPIGLDNAFIEGVQTPNHFVAGSEVRQLLVPREKFAHKGTYGHALLIGGSKGKTGAMVLSAKAAIKAGAGLTTVCVPNSSYTILQTAVPEAMCITDVEEDSISDIPKADAYSAIAIGPGMGVGEAQAQAVKKLLNYTQAPLVIDADALNILAENLTWLHFLPSGTILTPHPGEFDRLAQMPKGTTGYDRYLKQRELSTKFNCYIVLKGAYTSISCPDGAMFFNSTGNPGMATGGSGDVLTGIICGLLAQRYKPRVAAILGVYLHGLAGDIAADELSQQALSAGDIVAYLGKAFKHLAQ